MEGCVHRIESVRVKVTLEGEITYDLYFSRGIAIIEYSRQSLVVDSVTALQSSLFPLPSSSHSPPSFLLLSAP